jgi:flagellar basal-body rod modification protein FlgD
MADSTSSLFGTVGTESYTKYEDTLVRESKGDTLGKEDFLKLLVAQLTHQDPTEPMKDTEFVSQLATYSGLEQQMTMNQNLEKLITINAATTAASAVGLIGTYVGYTGDDGSLKSGLVAFIDIVNGDVNLYLDDGSYIPFSKVEQVGILYNGGSGTGAAETPAEGGGETETPAVDGDETETPAAEGDEGAEG